MYLLIDAIFICMLKKDEILEWILVFCDNFYYNKYGGNSVVSHKKFVEFGYIKLIYEHEFRGSCAVIVQKDYKYSW